MNVLLYTPTKNDCGKRLKQAIEKVISKKNIEECLTFEGLVQKVGRPEQKPGIGVLLTADDKELLELLSIRRLFENIRLILILADDSAATVSKGHILHPRFLSYVNKNFEDVAAVLNKMIVNEKARTSKMASGWEEINIKY